MRPFMRQSHQGWKKGCTGEMPYAKKVCALCVPLEKDKVKHICQHPQAGMHVWTHRHQRPVSGETPAWKNQGSNGN